MAVPLMNLSGVYVTPKNPLPMLGVIRGQIAVIFREMITIMIFSPQFLNTVSSEAVELQ